MEQESIWAKVSKFGVQGNRWDAGVASRSTYRSPWKYISSLYDEFQHLVSFKVGDGRRIRFWEDAWCDGVALSNRFANLFRISVASNVSIAEVAVSQFGHAPHGWNLRFYRNLHDWELEDYANLTVLLDQVNLNGESADIRIWQPDNSGGFSSKSASLAFQQEKWDFGISVLQVHMEISCPSKDKVFCMVS